jgi:hypothetical protein
VNTNTSRGATEDMLADLGVSTAEAAHLRALLGQVAGLAREVPEPSDDVRALLGGAISLGRRRRTVFIAAAVGALAFGGVSAAAAANRLPEPVQEIVADATGGVVPHPVKPTIPPYDAPGHVVSKHKATKTPHTSAPGQNQKSTKPDPTAPGPAHSVGAGSHGRAHNESNIDGADKLLTEPGNGKPH